MTGIFKLYFIYCYNAGIITVLGGGGENRASSTNLAQFDYKS